MNSPVAKIKESLPIEEIISSYIKLMPAGMNLKARCPFHNEKTPSFFVSPSRGSYYCFGCSASGDIFTFVQEFEGLDFKGALTLLAHRAGVSLQDFSFKENNNEKERLYAVMKEASIYFAQNLEKHPEVREYLKSRGLNQASIEDFAIGYAEPEWRTLYSQLRNKNFTDNEMETAGLIKRTEKGFYDRFRGRIMFPIADSSGRVIAFSGRLFPDESVPTEAGKPTMVGSKYLNSPETPIFNKSAVLYGLDKAKESIRKNSFSILVEGQMDLILSHQAGYKNAVATSGTALSETALNSENTVSNLSLVRRLSENIVLAFDADTAGFKASLRAGKIGLKLGMDVKVAAIPRGLDPADLISTKGVEAWKNAIKHSTHLIEFLLAKILGDVKGDNRKAGKAIKEMLLPFVNTIESSIERAHFIKKISDATSISESALQDDLKKLREESEVRMEETEESFRGGIFRKDYIKRKLLGILLWQKTLKEPGINLEEMLKDMARILHTDPKTMLEEGAPDQADLIFEAEVFYKDDAGLQKDIEELLSNLEEEYLHEERLRKMRELYVSEEKKDIDKGRVLLQEINEISNKIQAIKSKKYANEKETK